jgi:hypothetical protein
MILRRGITSFFNWDDCRTIPEFSFAEFRRVVHGMADSLRLAVSELKERGVTPNFHSARLNGSEVVITIVGHSTYPIFAFSVPPGPSECKLRFIDCPQIATELTRLFPDLLIAPAEELNRQPTKSDLGMLDAQELDQIKYSQPQSVGEIAFNWWD